MIAFATPFCLVGVGALVGAVMGVAEGDLAQAGFLSIFALTFGGAGFGLVAASISGHGKAKEELQRKTEHPDEPWTWKQEWADGRVRSAGGSAVWAVWIFAVVWNAISVPAGIAGVREGLLGTNRPALLALLFPLVGTGLLVWAIRQTMRHRKFGVSVFELAHIPGVVGRGVGGVLHTTIPLIPPDGFTATLTCVNRIVRGGGKNRSTSEKVVWQETQTVRETQRDGDRHGTIVPIVFPLPADVPETDERNPRDSTIWRLEVRADVPGIDYYARFELPVFRTADSLTAPERADDELLAVSLAEYEQPADSRIRVGEWSGRLEIHYGRARNPGVAFGVTIFTAVWTGIVAVLFVVDAPLFFPIVFGLFDLLMLAWTAKLWLGFTNVTATRDRITIRTGLLVASIRHVDVDDLQRIKVKIGMQSGNTPYYQVRLVDGNGKETEAGWGIRDKREAEWIAGRLRETTGIAEEAP